MRARATAIVALTGLLLVGCGLKGPLYLPNKARVPPASGTSGPTTPGAAPQSPAPQDSAAQTAAPQSKEASKARSSDNEQSSPPDAAGSPPRH
jgi:predicted small lipoprotein YifL